jgi:hypothetical protein
MGDALAALPHPLHMQGMQMNARNTGGERTGRGNAYLHLGIQDRRGEFAGFSERSNLALQHLSSPN